MDRIAIIGPPGAGKTTLARSLHKLLKIKVYHLDRLFWLPGWIRKDQETRRDILQKLVREKRWIIEGNYLNFFEIYLNLADTIIFFDFPPLVCCWRLLKRHNRAHGHSRRDIPEGCTNRLTLRLVAQTFPLNERRRVKQKVRDYLPKVIRLTSKNQQKDFLETTS